MMTCFKTNLLAGFLLLLLGAAQAFGETVQLEVFNRNASGSPGYKFTSMQVAGTSVGSSGHSGYNEGSGTLSLNPGQEYTAEFRYYNNGSGTMDLGFSFTPPEGYVVQVDDGYYVNDFTLYDTRSSDMAYRYYKVVLHQGELRGQTIGVSLAIDGPGPSSYSYEADLEFNGFQQHMESLHVSNSTPPGFTHLIPNKEYILTLNGGLFSHHLAALFKIRFVPPEGYELYVDGRRTPVLEGEILEGQQKQFSVVLREQSVASAPYGDIVGLDTDPARWSISLGSLPNGQSAGSIDFEHVNAHLELIEEIRFSDVQSEIEVLKDQLVLRQIKTSQMLLDILDIGVNEVSLNFYAADSAGPLSGGFYTFTGPPAISYSFQRESGGTGYSLTRVEGARSETFAFDGRTLVYPGSLKTLQKTVTASSPTSVTRDVAVKNASGTAERLTTERHDFFAFGKRLASRSSTVDSVQYQNSFSYQQTYTPFTWSSGQFSSPDWGGYGRVSSFAGPGGAASTFAYSSAPASAGNLLSRTDTHLDSGTTTTNYSHAADWNGSRSLLSSASRATPVDQDFGRSHDYGDHSNGEPLNKVLLSDFNGSSYEDSSVEYYRHHLWDTIYVDLPHASTAKDGRKVSHMYQEGAYDPATHEFRPVDWDPTAIRKTDGEFELSRWETHRISYSWFHNLGVLRCKVRGSYNDADTRLRLYDNDNNEIAPSSYSGDGHDYEKTFDITRPYWYYLELESLENQTRKVRLTVDLDTDPSDNVESGDHWRETRFHGWNRRTGDPDAYEFLSAQSTGYADDKQYFHDTLFDNGFGASHRDSSVDKWLTVDLGQPRFVGSVTVAGDGTVNGNSSNGWATRHAKIQKSDDGSQWTTVHDFGETEYQHGMTVPINDTARYWRLFRGTGGHLFVTEFRLSPESGFEDPAELATLQNKDVSPVWLVPRKSFKEVVIRGKAGYPVRTETHVYTGYSNDEYDFELVSWSDIQNDATGNTTRVEKSTGEILEWEYADGLMTAHVDAAGKRTEFQHDALGRVTRIVDKGAPAYGTYPAQADVVTDITYNALDQVLAKTVAAGTESLSYSWEYDAMGRLASETVPGPLTTTYQYAKETNGSITLTTTFPDGGTRKQKHFKDGSAKEITGSAVVAQYLNPVGNEVTATYGSPASSIQSRITFDSLYRDKTAEGSAMVPYEKRYDDFGRLISEKPKIPTGSTDYLPGTHYSYNTYGELSSIERGFQVDRYNREDYEYELEKIGGEWWKVAATYVYPEENGGRVLAGIVKTRVGGCACGSTFETRSYDIHGNETVTTVVTDRLNRIRREIINAPGTTEDVETVSHNGLTVERKSASGIVSSFQYDALRRPAGTIDPRKGATAVAYDAAGRVAHREDAAGKRISYEYDEYGRVASVEAPDGEKTYYEYNDRNQIRRTWGSNQTPVSYEYNDYGQRIKMTVYKPAVDGEGSSTNPYILIDRTRELNEGQDHSYTIYSSEFPTTSGTVRIYTTSDIDTRGRLRIYDLEGRQQYFFEDDNSGEGRNFRFERHVDAASVRSIGFEVKRQYNYGDPGYQPYRVIVEFVADDPSEDLQFGFLTNWNRTAGQTSYTNWNHSPYTGLLESKEIGNQTVAAYAYDDVFRVETVTNARNQSTTYSYDRDHNALSGIAYSDGTPSISVVRDRLGNIASVTDGAGTRDFAYDYASTLQLQSAAVPYASGLRIAPSYAATGPVIGRLDGFGLGTAASANLHHQTTYGYDAYGRLDSVAGAAGGPLRPFDYGYLASSNLVSSIGQTGAAFVRSYAYDPQRDLLASVDNLRGGASIARFDYRHDDMGRRTDVTKTGSLFNLYGASGLVERYEYNPFGELASAQSYLGSDPTATLPALPGRSFQFGYDYAGNRTSSAANGLTTDYDTVEGNNQYWERQVPRSTDLYGADDPAAAVTVDGQAASRAGEYFHAQATTASANAAYLAADIQSVFGGSTQNQTAHLYLDAATSEHRWDSDGNPAFDDRFAYVFDINNRLVELEDKAVAGDPNLRGKLTFDYDYLGRRWRKRAFEYTGGTWNQTEEIKYVYAAGSFNLVAELDGMNADAVMRTYTWGKDLSGSLQGAGGVGGLLMVTESGTDYLVSYDGNGNVVGLTNATTGELAAAYEYSPYGKLIRSEGPMAEKNPFRFSTKYQDDESGLLYYGLRYYDPAIGRFINRDPIEERGGLNLYAAFYNDPINRIDVLGMYVPGEDLDGYDPGPAGGYRDDDVIYEHELDPFEVNESQREWFEEQWDGITLNRFIGLANDAVGSREAGFGSRGAAYYTGQESGPGNSQEPPKEKLSDEDCAKLAGRIKNRTNFQNSYADRIAAES